MLLSDKFYRSFVLAPCEICVVPFGHRKIAVDRNDISLANMKSWVESQYMLARRFAPSSMAIYPSKNTPCSNTSLRSPRCRLYCIIVDSILNRRADYISSSIRLAAYTSMRRIAPLDVAVGQPAPPLVIRWLTVKEKRHVT